MTSAFDRLHPGIQRALWDQQWSDLRPLQVQTIEAFSADESSLILSASTASGKTEAAFLPVLSAIADDSSGSIRAIYVGPLKALINDQFRRLEDLCLHTGIPVHRWHGDVSSSDKERLRSEPGGVLLITPESLESAFINYGNRLPKIFAALDYIVIDELHSFIGDVRGVHLRSLIARLAQIIGKKPRILGLSATLADFESARRFLDSKNPGTVKVVADPGLGRPVKMGLRAYPQPKPRQPEDEQQEPAKARAAATALEASEDLATLSRGQIPERWSIPADASDGNALELLAIDIADVFKERTNLIFINSRGTGEMLTDELNEISRRQRWQRNPFLLHHGSLSKEIREDVEERLKKGEPLSVFCTSTLEMGIDIGSVYSVGQLGPPWSVASLVQRLGRSGRREGETAILRLFSLDPPPGPKSTPDELLCPQLIRSIAMVELMREKWLEPFENGVPQYSTLIHQTLSLLRQTGGCPFIKLRDTLLTHGAFQDVTIAQYKSLLKSLAAHELIEQMASGEIILAPVGERLTHSKDFYAAFQGTTEYSIRYGQLDIGKLPQTSLPLEGENFLLNGRRWKVEQIDPKALVVEVTPARSRKAPLFLGAAGSIHSRIAAKMAEILQSGEVPAYLHPDAAALLQSARSYALANGVFTKPYLEKVRYCILLPWTGTKGLETLRVFAKADGIDAAINNLTLTYRCSAPDLQRHLEKVASGFFQARDHAALVSGRYADKYDSYLPDELLDLSNSLRMLSQEDAMSSVQGTLARS